MKGAGITGYKPPISSFAQDFAGGLQAGSSIGETIGDMREDDIVKQIGAAVQSAGGDLNAVDPMLYSSPQGMRALGKYMDQYTKTQEGVQKAGAAFEGLVANQYESANAAMQYLEQNKDNPEAFNEGLKTFSSKLGMPYKAAPGTDGNYDVVYQSREGDMPTGRKLTRDDILAGFRDSLADKGKFRRLMAQHYISINRANNAYRQDPKYWMFDKDKTGTETVLIPQKQYDQNGGLVVGYQVLQRGKPVTFQTMESLAQNYGILPNTREDVRKQELNDARVGAYNAAATKARGGALGLKGDGLGKEDAKWITEISKTEDAEGNKGYDAVKGSALELLIGEAQFRRNDALQLYEAGVEAMVEDALKKHPDTPREQIVNRARREYLAHLTRAVRGKKLGAVDTGGKKAEPEKKPETKTADKKQNAALAGAALAENEWTTSGHRAMSNAMARGFTATGRAAKAFIDSAGVPEPDPEYDPSDYLR